MNKFLLTIFVLFILHHSAFTQVSELLSPTAKEAFEKENYAPCIAEFSKIISQQPKNDVALTERARCFYFTALAQIAAIRPLNEKLKTIVLNEKAALQTNIEGENKKISESLNNAMLDVEKAILLNPNNANAFNIRGRLKETLKKNDEAIADYTKAIEVDAKFVKPYLNRGSLRIRNKDFSGAIADYSKAIEIEPNNTIALLGRVNAHQSNSVKYSETPEYMQLVKDVKKVIEVDVKNERGHIILVNLCFSEPNSYGNCVQVATKFKTEIPNSAAAHFLHGLAISQREGKLNSAAQKTELWKNIESSYLKAIELDPNYSDAYVKLFDLYNLKFGEYSKATDIAERAVAKFPNNAVVYVLRGNANFQKNDFESARISYEKATELAPKYAYAFKRLGETYHKKGNFQKALTNLDKAVLLEPNSTNLSARGDFYYEQKQYTASINDYSAVIKLGTEPCAYAFRARAYMQVAVSKGTAKAQQGRQKDENIVAAENDLGKNVRCDWTAFYLGELEYYKGNNYQARQQFAEASEVFKANNWNTSVITEAIARVKQSEENGIIANSQTPTNSQNNSRESAENYIKSFLKSGQDKGATLVSRGVYDYEEAFDQRWRFNIIKGATYFFIAVKEYDGSNGMQIISDGNNLMNPTYDWDEKVARTDRYDNYALKTGSIRSGKFNLMRMILTITKNSNINAIQFSPNGKPTKTHWALTMMK